MLDRVNFDHVVCLFPVDINSGAALNGDDEGNGQVVFTAVFEIGCNKWSGLVLLQYLASLGADLPAMDEFIFRILIGCKNNNMISLCLNFLNVVAYFNCLHDCHFFDVEDYQLIDPKDHQNLITQACNLSTVLVLFAKDLDPSVQGEVI